MGQEIDVIDAVGPSQVSFLIYHAPFLDDLQTLEMASRRRAKPMVCLPSCCHLSVASHEWCHVARNVDILLRLAQHSGCHIANFKALDRIYYRIENAWLFD